MQSSFGQRRYVIIVSLGLLVTLASATVYTRILPSFAQGNFVATQGFSMLTSPHPPRTNNTVLFIHGINKYSQLDCNGYTTWGAMKRFLKNDQFDPRQRPSGPYIAHKIFGKVIHWTDNLVTLGFYWHDKDCDDYLYRDQNADKLCGVKDLSSLTDDTSIETLSCLLAWYIYDNYTKENYNVRVVAHSMGGLMIRYALYATNTHMPGFPTARLLVSDVATIATPHAGFPPLYQFSDLGAISITSGMICSFCTQGEEMLDNSELISRVLAQPGAQSPKGAQGTNWTMIGSDVSLLEGATDACTQRSIESDCLTEAANSQTAMKGGHQVRYQCSPALCYGHGSYLIDTDLANNAEMKRCDTDTCAGSSSDSNWPTLSGMPRSLYYILYALESPDLEPEAASRPVGL